MNDTLRVALLSDVFFGEDAPRRLAARLRECRDQGAELAVLPEIPLNPWSPATKVARDEDAELPGGARHTLLSATAKRIGIALLGGAIVKDGKRRFNTALLHDSKGELVGTYRKLHLPEEPGFWETSHYEPGEDPPRVLEIAGFPIGIQICSDVNRPTVTHALAAAGALAVLAPRATESGTYDSWRLVFRANALTSSCYVLSVNRPAPEQGVPLGGPSVAVDPMGEPVAEGAQPILVATLEREAVLRARKDYPGYLAVRRDLYSKAWSAADSRASKR